MASKTHGCAHALAAFALAIAAESPSLRADEAFLCGPDNIVYVKSADLELRKKTDPCIARYFGLQAEKPSEATSTPSRPLTVAGRKSDVSNAVALKSLQPPETTDRISRTPERTAAAEPPAPAPGTDFRNVRVINASSPADQWFKHTR